MEYPPFHADHLLLIMEYPSGNIRSDSRFQKNICCFVFSQNVSMTLVIFGFVFLAVAGWPSGAGRVVIFVVFMF